LAFIYRARDRRGREVTGKLEVSGRRAALQKLKSRKLYPVSLERVEDEARKHGEGSARDPSVLSQMRKVDRRELALVLRQLATMLGSGLTLLSALETLRAQKTEPAFRQALRETARGIEQGKTLAESLEAHPRLFPAHLCGMIYAGEEAGMLTDVLLTAASTFENEAEVVGQIKNALLYPALVMLVAGAAVIVLISFVIPAFRDILLSMGLPLPLPTRLLLGFAASIADYGYYLGFSGGGLLLLLMRTWHLPQPREIRFGLLLRLPLVGPLYFKMLLARTCRILGALVSSGLTLTAALRSTRALFNYRQYHTAIEALIHSVEEGNRLSQTAKLHELGVPAMVINMLQVGEDSGNLASVLREIAEHYERELKRDMERLTVLIEPALILIVGVVVGSVILSTVLPLFTVVSEGF